MYKEPLRLPVENLPGALGDTRKLSVSNGLEGSKGQAVIDGQRPLDHRQDQETRDRGLGGDRHSGGTPGPCSEASWKRLRYPLPQGSLARWGGAPIGPFDWRPFEKLSRAVADTQSCRLCVNHVTAAHRFPPGQGAPVTVPGGAADPQGKHQRQHSSQVLACPWSSQGWVGPPCLVDTCMLSAASARWPSSRHLEPSPATRACGPGALPGRPPACPGQLRASGTPRSLDLPDLGLQGTAGPPPDLTTWAVCSPPLDK